MAEPPVEQAIDFSLPEVVEKDDEGNLCVKIPPKIAARLGVGERDVLCFGVYENGVVELWAIDQSPYATLE